MTRPRSRWRLAAVVCVLICLCAVVFPHAAVAADVATQPAAGAPGVPSGTLAERAQSLVGLVAFVGIAFAIGRMRGAKTFIPKRTLIWGLVLQFGFGLVVSKNREFLKLINDVVDALLGFTADGAKLVFGNLVFNNIPVGNPGAYAPMADITPSGHWAAAGAYFAFFVVPTIIFFSCLMAVLYHTGVMQYVVQGLAWLMSKTMKTSGAETLSSAANIFVGQTEAPLMVKPFMALATNSELMAIMVGGFANIASGVLGLYKIWLDPYLQDAAGHLAAACFITAPGSLLVAKLMVPETGYPKTAAGVEFKVEKIDANLVDAAARGTSEGLALALNVAAMLISFTALVALTNAILGWASVKLHLCTPDAPLTLQIILGYILRPLAWLIGVPWGEAKNVGALLGIKTVLNELIAYSQMKDNLAAGGTSYLSPRSVLLATYALCGFANFASVGIQVGGISSLAPTRRADLSRIGLLAMIGGAISSLMAACVVGVLV